MRSTRRCAAQGPPMLGEGSRRAWDTFAGLRLSRSIRMAEALCVRKAGWTLARFHMEYGWRAPR